MYRNSVGLIVALLLTFGNNIYIVMEQKVYHPVFAVCWFHTQIRKLQKEEKIYFSLFLELKDCQSFTATSYNYSSFYELHSISEKIEDHYLLDLKIHAIAQKDVYILLTPTTNISNDSQLFELGMCLKTFSIKIQS